MHEKRIQRFFPGGRGLVTLAASASASTLGLVMTPPSPRRSSLAEFVADKVNSFFRDVQKRCRARPERRGERDAVVVGTNGDFPAEAARKRNGDLPRVGTDLNVEVRTWSMLPVVWAMLFVFFCFFCVIFRIFTKEAGEFRRTSFALTEPEWLRRVMEARFDLPLGSGMIHISALTDPFDDSRRRLWFCLEIKTPSYADCSSGGMERSRAYWPSMGAFGLDTRR